MHISERLFVCVCLCVCVCVWLVFLTHGQTKPSARRGRTRLKRIWSRCFAGLSLTSFHQLSTSSFPSSFALMDAEWFAVFVEAHRSGRWRGRGKTNRGCWHWGGRIRRQLVLLAWVLSYVFASACHMRSLSLAVCVFISYHKVIKNNNPFPSDIWASSVRPLSDLEISTCGHI